MTVEGRGGVLSQTSGFHMGSPDPAALPSLENLLKTQILEHPLQVY